MDISDERSGRREGSGTVFSSDGLFFPAAKPVLERFHAAAASDAVNSTVTVSSKNRPNVMVFRNSLKLSLP